MEVEAATPSNQSTRLVLKIYDHRYVTKLEEEDKAQSFFFPQETTYSGFFQHDDSLDFLTRPRGDRRFIKPEWNVEQTEIYLLHECLDLYERECAVYDRLKDFQGRDIPQLIAKVRLPVTPSWSDVQLAEYYKIKGILLELIDGFTLSQLVDKAPRKDWQKICDQAIGVVQLCDEWGILNEDVRAANVLVTPLPLENAYRVVLLDLAFCRLRDSDEFGVEWRRTKGEQNDEGAIAMEMQDILQKVGFDLVYEPSCQYLGLGTFLWLTKKYDDLDDLESMLRELYFVIAQANGW
ncbi:hypothetical protein MMC29_000867 [Sticta canariensis]|nr:hypothetical protein [Sticta canariensis]